MNQPQLPAYLQNLPIKAINEAALAGIGATLPPHISIRGNTFTLVDASGATQPAGPQLDVCVADISDQMNKQFYGAKWTPDSNEPPLCWSANGIGPSRDAIEPQAPLCDGCPNNVRGSAVSALSGAAIKSCRDEKWLAVLIPSLPQVRFQLKVTPGSFKTWQAYVKTCEGNQTQINTVLTRVGFQAGVNGVLTFQAVSYIDENTAKVLSAGYAEKAFDVLVGRNDVPRQVALPAPAAAPQIAAQQVQQPVPFGAPAAATQFAAALSVPAFAGPASAPTEGAPRRRRRTTAEIAADNAQATQAAPQGQPAAPVAPFRPQPPQQETLPPATNPPFLGGVAQPPAAPGFAPPPAPGAGFGMAPGVAPNPELQSALDGMFGKK